MYLLLPFFPSFPSLLKWIILLTTHFYAYIFRKRRFKGSQEKGNEGSWFYYPCLHVCIPQFVLFSCILKCHNCICAIFYETGSGERAGGRKDRSFEKVRFIWLFIAVLRRVKCQHRFWSFYLQRKKTWVHPRAMHSGETVVRALTSHQCGPRLNPGMDASCRLSLLLVLSFVRRGFSLGTPFSPLLKINISKFQFDQESAGRRTTKWMLLPLCCYLLLFFYGMLVSWREFY